MTPEETQALVDIRGYAAAGRIRYSKHFLQDREGFGPDKRGAVREDVLRAIATAKNCTKQRTDVYLTEDGVDLDGERLRVVCALDRSAGVFVITVTS